MWLSNIFRKREPEKPADICKAGDYLIAHLIKEIEEVGRVGLQYSMPTKVETIKGIVQDCIGNNIKVGDEWYNNSNRVGGISIISVFKEHHV